MGCAGSKGGAAKETKKKEDKPADAPAEGEAESAPAAEEQPVSTLSYRIPGPNYTISSKVQCTILKCVTSSLSTSVTQRLKVWLLKSTSHLRADLQGLVSVAELRDAV